MAVPEIRSRAPIKRIISHKKPIRSLEACLQVIFCWSITQIRSIIARLRSGVRASTGRSENIVDEQKLAVGAQVDEGAQDLHDTKQDCDGSSDTVPEQPTDGSSDTVPEQPTDGSSDTVPEQPTDGSPTAECTYVAVVAVTGGGTGSEVFRENGKKLVEAISASDDEAIRNGKGTVISEPKNGEVIECLFKIKQALEEKILSFARSTISRLLNDQESGKLVKNMSLAVHRRNTIKKLQPRCHEVFSRNTSEEQGFLLSRTIDIALQLVEGTAGDVVQLVAEKNRWLQWIPSWLKKVSPCLSLSKFDRLLTNTEMELASLEKEFRQRFPGRHVAIDELKEAVGWGFNECILQSGILATDDNTTELLNDPHVKKATEFVADDKRDEVALKILECLRPLPNSLLIYSYSGHGEKNKKLHDDILPEAWLEAAARLASHVFVLIDSCSAESKIPKLDHPGYMYIAACTNEQATLYSKSHEHCHLTHLFILALNCRACPNGIWHPQCKKCEVCSAREECPPPDTTSCGVCQEYGKSGDICAFIRGHTCAETNRVMVPQKIYRSMLFRNSSDEATRRSAYAVETLNS